MTLTHAESRRRANRVRNVAKALVLVALLAASASVVVLSLNVDLLGGSRAFAYCGTVLDPVSYQTPLEQESCAGELRSMGVIALAIGLGGVVAAVIATILFVRTPAPQRF